MKKKYAFFTAVIAVLLAASITASAHFEAPQKYSADDYETAPIQVEVPPEPTKQKEIYTFLNAEKVEMKTAAVKKDGIVYVPVADFFLRAGLNVSTKGGVSISNDVVKAEFKSGKNTGTVNGKSVTLSAKLVKIKGVLMCPADMIAEVLNAKVWFDEESKTLAVSTGSFKNDGILRIINYKYWMDGEPYYEISFNKFDLFGQIASSFDRAGEWSTVEQTLPAAEEALSILHEKGFKTIRSFVHIPQRAAYVRSEKGKQKYYEIMDTAIDLIEKYDIKVVFCLALPSADFCPKGEDYFDLMCNPESESRKNLYNYIDDFIARYKDRKCVLMWEVVNEGNLETDIGWTVKKTTISLAQLGQFYTDVAERIRMTDPVHLITGGDSGLRSSQWHQYLGVKEGMIGTNWTKDTLEDRMKAYIGLYSGLDVISMHCYSTGLSGTEYQKSETDTTMVPESFELMMQECRRAGKVLYNGETAVNAEEYNDEIYQASLGYLQDIIKAGVQISHWWTFHADDNTNGKHKGYPWDISYGELLDAIIAANKQLKDTYVVNGIANAGTCSAWNGDEVVISNGPVSIDESLVKAGCGASLTGEVSVIMCMMIVAAAVILTKKKISE